jgi:hypothetical protein
LQDWIKELKKLPEADKLSRDIQTENRRRYDESLGHDEWSSKKQAKLQDHHHDQTARVSDEHHKRRLREHDRMEASYKLKEQKEAIKNREQKISKPPVWKRVLGITRKDRRRLEELKAGYNDARHRYDERMGHLEQQRETALAQLKRQQTNEKQNNLNQSLTSRPEGYLTQEQRRAIDTHQPREERSQARSRGGGFDRGR